MKKCTPFLAINCVQKIFGKRFIIYAVDTFYAGTIYECQVVNGVAMRKNVSDRKMRQRVEGPRILILTCALEFHRKSTIASLEVCR